MINMRNDGEVSYILHFREFFHSFLQKINQVDTQMDPLSMYPLFTAEHITRQ